MIYAVLSLWFSFAHAQTSAQKIFKQLPYGMNLISGSQSFMGTGTAWVLIHGVNETGEIWGRLLDDLLRNPKTRIYFFKWNQWSGVKSIRKDLGESLSEIIDDASLTRVRVVAHSAGGVMLLNSLCAPTEASECSFSPRASEKEFELNTVASPHGGFGYGLAGLSKPVIGPVKAFIGKNVSYPAPAIPIRVRVFTTSPENDENAVVKGDKDNRFPKFSSGSFEIIEEHLPHSTHEGALWDAYSQL